MNLGSSRRVATSVAGFGLALGLITVPAHAEAPLEIAERLPSTGGLEVANHSFEEVLSDDGEIPGWSGLWLGETVWVEVSDDRASDGTNSLLFVDEDDSRGGAFVSDPIAVEPHRQYQLTVDLFVETGRINSTYYFLDEDGERVDTVPINWTAPAGRWATRDHMSPAPEGATHVQVVFDSGGSNTVRAYVDNVRLRGIEPRDDERSLGEPITEVLSHGVGYTTDSAGRSLGVLITRGTPSVASVVDIETGALIHSQEMSDVYQAWSYITAADGSVYIGTDSRAIVYRFDPDAMTIEEIARGVGDQTHLWATDITPAGTVVYGTYPDGKVVSYEPSTDSWTDHGSVVEGENYIRSLAVYDDETVYVGTGSNAQLARVDLRTDEVEVLPVPEGQEDADFTYDVDIRGERLFARYTPGNSVHVMDLTTHEWVDTVASPGAGLNVSPAFERPGTDGAQEVIIPTVGGGAVSYDLQSGESRDICFDLGGSGARKWSQVPMNLTGASPDAFVTSTTRGVFYSYDPQVDECAVHRTQPAGSGIRIRSLEAGPDGHVYAGGASLTRVDVDNVAYESLPNHGQAMQLHSHGDYLVAGTYTGAGIVFYDTDEPISAGTNPRPPVYISEGQDRTVAITSMGERVAVGTVPTPNQLGGALGIIDPETLEFEVFQEPVPDQSVLALQYRDGLLYGGTGVSGGVGAEPAHSDGRLFIFDPEAQEVIFETAPVPGDGHVSGLTFDPDGNLWGVTGNSVFRFDTQAREVTSVESYFDSDDSATYFVGRNIEWAGDRIVAVTNSRLFELDPATMQKTDLAEGVELLTVDKHGAYYYARQSELLQWMPTTSNRCDETLTGDVRGPTAVNTGLVCIDDATVRGPINVFADASLSVTDSEIRGPITSDRAESIVMAGSDFSGSLHINGTSGVVELASNTARGVIRVTESGADATVMISGNQIQGSIFCDDNAHEPRNEGAPNYISGMAGGQCSEI